MTAALADLARQFRFNEATIGMIVDGFEDADWSRAPGEHGGNTAHWLLGHLAHSRRYILRKIDADLPEADWEEAFTAGAQPSGTDDYPSPTDLMVDFTTSGERISERFAELSDEDAAAAWGGDFPDGASTIDGGFRFLFFHECYHVGQLGLLRRIAGKPGFV